MPENEVQEKVLHALFEEYGDPALPLEKIKIGKEFPATWQLRRLRGSGLEEELWIGLHEAESMHSATEVALFRISIPYFMQEYEIKARSHYRGMFFSVYFGTLMGREGAYKGFVFEWKQDQWRPDSPLLAWIFTFIESFRRIRAKFPEQEEKPI